MFPRAVTFDIEELWLLQSAIRHESPDEWAGSYPPTSVDLNDQIAAALASGDKEAVLILTRADLFAIDYTVPQHAKDRAGNLIGFAILLKSFKARLPDPALPDLQELTDANDHHDHANQNANVRANHVAGAQH